MTDAGNTRYYAVISPAEPEERVHATCRAGTTCRDPRKVPIVADQEMSWGSRS